MVKERYDIIIYGAGAKARKLYSMISQLPINIKTFAVSQDQKAIGEFIEGLPVKSIADFTEHKDRTIVLIGVSEKFLPEINEQLNNLGFENVIPYPSNTFDLYPLIDFDFDNRQKKYKKLCIILAGYKEFLWDNVFHRLSAFMPDDVDVCVLSSGIYNPKLSELCRQNDWSYLRTHVNCVTLIQNLAIILHPNAEMIYKIDEDIFITKYFFSETLNVYNKINTDTRYYVGFVAPIIPINAYGHIRVLERLGLIETFENKFNKAKYLSNVSNQIESNPDVAKFFWGDGGFVPHLDKMAEMFYDDDIRFSICPIRFSIGAVLFSRSLWADMGGFKVIKGNPCMGVDEEQLCSYCITQSKIIAVAEKTVVGHLSFGSQNAEMKKYYLEHSDRFRLIY